MVTGQNVLAVEVHQRVGTSSDIVMGLEMTAEQIFSLLEREYLHATAPYTLKGHRLQEENKRLQAEVDQLTCVDDFIVITRASIKELAEEGVQNTPGQYDEKYTISVSKACYIKVLKHMSEFWNAAKKGGQP